MRLITLYTISRLALLIIVELLKDILKSNISAVRSNFIAWVLASHWLLNPPLWLSSDRPNHYTMQMPVDLQSVRIYFNYQYHCLCLCQTISYVESTSSHAGIKLGFENISFIHVLPYLSFSFQKYRFYFFVFRYIYDIRKVTIFH